MSPWSARRRRTAVLFLCLAFLTWLLVSLDVTPVLYKYILSPISGSLAESANGKQPVQAFEAPSGIKIVTDGYAAYLSWNKGGQQTARPVVGQTVEQERPIDSSNDQAKPAGRIDYSQIGKAHTKLDEIILKEGYKNFSFNLLASNRIGFWRPVPDTRPESCKTKTYPASLPTVSIIICHYNEAASVLIRMVNSILQRTPMEYVAEVLLLDDHNEPPTKLLLGDYAFAHWPDKVKFHRTSRREGLIRARNMGAYLAQGEVLLFMDSHCEVNEAWLEPLLDRLQSKPDTVVSPVIDVIDADTFEYIGSPICIGGMNWKLHFKWDYPESSYFNSSETYSKPLSSPTMAGGLFAMWKTLFHNLGDYDNGMELWGGENVEMSIRVWTCGYRIEVLPCSRVGHVFRRRRPYPSPFGYEASTRNNMRTAVVWLDEYLARFLDNKEYEQFQHSYGDVSARKALRKRLHCRPFRWFLENVYPRLEEDEKALAIKTQRMTKAVHRTIQLETANGGSCLAFDNGYTKTGSELQLLPCKSENVTSTWTYTEAKQLRITSGDLCLDSEKTLSLRKCNVETAAQQWTFQEDGSLYNTAAGTCLALSVGLIGLETCEQENVLRLQRREIR